MTLENTAKPFWERFTEAHSREGDPFGTETGLPSLHLSASPTPTAPVDDFSYVYPGDVFSPFGARLNTSNTGPRIPVPAVVRRTTPSVHTTVANQREILLKLAETFKEQGQDPDNALRGFSHAYGNTIDSHLQQLDGGEFNEPEVMNHFAINFARRYQQNLDALRDPKGTAEPHWQNAWNRGKEIDLLPVPEGAKKSAQILYGKTAHIDYDLKRSLTEALDYKAEHFEERGSEPNSLARDFLTAGEHFEDTANKTATEMGLPQVLVDLGNLISNVPGHRLRRFKEWVKELF